MRRAFWASFVAAGAVYGIMVAWSLPFIAQSAGGLHPFDLRPMGYSFDEAAAFLSALSQEGRAFYLDVQLKLDLLYPALLGLMLILGFHMLFGKRLATVLGVLAMVAVASDYLENYLVSVMLQRDVALLDANLVALASFWTISKSLANTLCFLALLIGALFWAWRRWMR